MSPESLPLGEVKNRLSEVVDRVEREHHRVVVTRHGRAAAVIMSVDDLQELEETLEVLGDAALMRQLAAASAERDRGDVTRMTKAEAMAAIRARGPVGS